jgi:hypothetical protein
VAERKPRYKPTDAEKKAINELKHCIEEARRWHTTFAQKVERRYSAWRGMTADNAPKGWRSNIHQPLLINVVEGMLSSMEEAEPQWKVKPRAVPGMSLEEVVAATTNAEVSQHLLQHQMRVDDFAHKQGAFMQQDLIAGFTPGKISWILEERPHRFLDDPEEMVYDETGGTIDIVNVLDEYEEIKVFRDDPTFEPRDVRDFLYPESATSVDTAPWIVDRTFVHYKTLERMEENGVYKNVRFVKETRHNQDTTTRQGPDVVAEREQRLRNADRTRGLVEICELWTDERVITVANRSVLLRDEPNPFSHGRKPFVVCSAIPDAFQIPGISVIEGLAQMQEMVWTLQNLRLDTTRMAANLITLLRGDVENPDDYEWAPGAQWVVTDPNQVKTLEVDPRISQTTMQAESLLKGDIQNVMGGLPYTGGAESQTIDQKTATGISIVTNIAQAILARRKQQYLRTFGRIGQHFLALDQQFLREPRLVEIVGEANSSEYIEVDWKQIRGIFDVNVQMQGDSMMRQERRAESGALLTMALQAAPLMVQMGVPLDLRRFWEKHLEAYDVTDKLTYFAQPSPSPLQAGGGAPGTPQGAESLMEDASGQLAIGGQTNAALAAGPTAPSNGASLSGGAAMQQALAKVGSGRSV